ncbi:hypothetical protein DR950_05950 [Kitasatospora xanthocidica]|uniref:Uncharacterized protein n=1 Tax=Kitasatospora xanthocidica TaxID=83382 RepID=A0A372ZQB8_9ACTN|nr:hypothetical protein DR950_05950 [Kitasatospora xanthocidica]
MLGALLDRSLVQIADAAADARCFDRETIHMAADVWDNNTFPLFRAATAGTRGGRERRSLAALEWMAGLGEDRRTWMIEQAAAAGHSLDGLLTSGKPSTPGRDYLGQVMAPVMSLTAHAAESLAADYDLSSAEVRHLRIERAGSRLVGQLELAVTRSYPVDDGTPAESATLNIWLRDITEVRFDSDDARGAVLGARADGVSIALGARGILRAATADHCPDDRCWHLSSAGRQADATTPPRDTRPARGDFPQEGHLGANAMAAATVLHRAMLHVRMVRSPRHADRVPVRGFHRAFTGAGEAILAAGAHRLPHRREAAFRHLVETWVGRGGPALAKWFASELAETVHRPDLLVVLRDQDQPHPITGTSQQPTPNLATVPGPVEVELRMASYTSAHTRYGADHDASALVHLAVPPHPRNAENDPWRLRAMCGAGPARFQLRTAAFQGAGRPSVTADDKAARRFALHDGALDITRREG